MKSKTNFTRIFSSEVNYKKIQEICLVFVLLFCVVFCQALPKKFANVAKMQEQEIVEIELEEIPQTEQLEKAPPPPRPSVPIPTEDEDVPEDLTMEETEIDFTEEPPPPPPPPSEENDVDNKYVFIPYDKPPAPIGGFAAIQRELHYPEIAQRAGVEATVIVGVLVDENGNVVNTQILKPSGANVGFEEEAKATVKKVKWKPAFQRDKPVKVWVSIPIFFKLRDVEKGK